MCLLRKDIDKKYLLLIKQKKKKIQIDQNVFE